MRNVSGYLTEDGKFFQEKKEAEAHEKLLGINKMIESFVFQHLDLKTKPTEEVLQLWERYKMGAMK